MSLIGEAGATCQLARASLAAIWGRARIALECPTSCRCRLDLCCLRRRIGGLPQRLYDRPIEDVASIKGVLRLHDEAHRALRKEEPERG